MAWQIKLLGTVNFEEDEHPSPLMSNERGCALLSYLLVTKQVQKREVIADMLWEANTTSQSLANLRMLLTRTRRQIGILEVTRTSISVPTLAPITVDLYQLEEGLADEDLTKIDAALAHYKGPLLEGFYIDDAPAFQQWLNLAREELRRKVFTAYFHLCTSCAKQSQWQRGIESAQRWLALDPLNEDAVYQLTYLLSRNGQQREALQQYENCSALLEQELDVTPRPDLRLLAQQIQAENSALAMVPIAPDSSSHNLPRQLLPFFGREQEIAQIDELLGKPRCRVVTIVGLGGMGKTSVAIMAGQKLLPRFRDGVWFINLAPISQDTPNVEDVIVDLIASVIGLHFRGDSAPKTQLINAIATKHILLILDNFEHLADHVDLILELLQETEWMALLVTSREPLYMRAEHLLRLEGLPTPSCGDPMAAEFPSISLFMEQVQRIDPNFCLGDKELNCVRNICTLVDGVPLAVEIAASMCHQRSLPEIHQAIAETVDSLHSVMRDVPARHRNIRAVFEESWRLLTVLEQEALAMLSTCKGAFDTQAAQSIASIEHDTIMHLCDKSLVQPLPEGYYQLHMMVQEYAAEKLARQTDLSEQTFAAHTNFYLRYVYQREKALFMRDSAQAVAEIDRSISDIRAAWQWALANQAWAAIGEAAEGLSRFYYHKSMRQEGLTVFGEAVAQLRNFGIQAERTDTVRTDAAWQRALAGSLAEWSYYLREEGDYDQGIAAADELLTLPIAQASPKLQMLAHARKGELYTRQAKLSIAMEAFEAALELAKSQNFTRYQAHVERQIAIVHLELGHLPKARTHLHRSVPLYRQIDDTQGEGNALNILGVVAMREGNIAMAEGFYAKALPLFREVNAQDDEAMLLMNQGGLANDRGQWSLADTIHTEALALFRELYHRRGIMMTYGSLGITAMKTGRYALAEHYLQESLILADQLNEQREMMVTQRELGQLYWEQGLYEKALDLQMDSLRMAQEIGSSRSQAIAKLHIGQVYIGMEQLTEAAPLVQQALDTFTYLGQEKWITRGQITLAQVWYGLGNQRKAYASIEGVLGYMLEPNTEFQMPFAAFVIAYQILTNFQEAAIRESRAERVLESGYRLLQQQAEWIDDDDIRASFLGNVAVHREIESLWQTRYEKVY